MTQQNTVPVADYSFALRSGERATLRLEAGQEASVRLTSKSFPESAGLVSAAQVELPSGIEAHGQNILVMIAEKAAQLNDKLPGFKGDFCSLAQTSLEQAVSVLNLKAEAAALLHDYADSASLEQDVMASREKQGWLKEVRDGLAAWIDRCEDFPNKSFRGLGEAAARCLLLYRDDPDAYAVLTGGICRDETGVFLDSLMGLANLESLVRGLSDDHNFVFNPATRGVEYQGPGTERERGLVPATFLSYVKAAQADSAAKKGRNVSP